MGCSSTQSTAQSAPGATSARTVVVGTCATIVALVVLAGCGSSSESASRLVDPQEFAASVAEPSTVTINVHVPDEGTLEGTDLALPFDEIERRADELPPVKKRVALYCKSGRMSAIAARTLARLGYRDIVELRGGMDAWREAGRPLVEP